MAFRGLNDFIRYLESSGELVRINTFVDPELEVTEITDRVSKSGGPALLFENNGTDFPILINAYGSDKRMSAALNRKTLDEAGMEINRLFNGLTASGQGLLKRLSVLPLLGSLGGILPSRSNRKGKCQQVIMKTPDLFKFPVMKCWPYDGGRFITLPVVNTYHPATGKTNAGMYRMQVIDSETTAMHWQMHKTGANHYNAWKEAGRRMPVSVILGGDPVYTYAATAPLPENIDEYIFAGFLRKKRVNLIKCITNDIYVPEDADIVLEGYVDPSEGLFLEGPFGDHTGFYSLSDWYPKFHLTCITHRKDAVYPSTVVGIPPMEDAFFAKATEKIFLSPIKLTLQPEILDLHMPEAGVAHNLAIIKISKSYPGQGMKVINSLLGAGQMMFTKYLIVVSGEIDIRDYRSVASAVFSNADLQHDILLCRGPLDVLDHSSDKFAFGGKMGIDATVKSVPEKKDTTIPGANFSKLNDLLQEMKTDGVLEDYSLGPANLPVAVLSARQKGDQKAAAVIGQRLTGHVVDSGIRLILVVDSTVDPFDIFMVSWQVLGNSDPLRDHSRPGNNILMMDGTVKFFHPGGFERKWPNIVCSGENTIDTVNDKWKDLGFGSEVKSPSLSYVRLRHSGKADVTETA